MTEKRKRRWWHRLVSLVASAINPLLGLAVEAAFMISYNEKSSGLDLDSIDPTPLQELQAQNIILNQATPTINNLTTEIVQLSNNTILTDEEIIIELNDKLTKIATIQAWINLSKSNTNNMVNFIVAHIIEPLLAKMNTLVTNVLNIQNLQGIVESTTINQVVSNTTQIGNFTLNWNNNQVFKTFQNLVIVSLSETNTEIIPSLENSNLTPELLETSEELPSTNVLETKTNIKYAIIPLLLGSILFYSRTKKEKIGLKGSKKICNDRFNCKGINKKTGFLKKGNVYKKGGKIAKIVNGLDNNGRLKKGFKYKNGKPVKVEKRKNELKKPLKIEL